MGQLFVSINEQDVPYTTPTFSTYCVDLNHDIFPPPYGSAVNLPYDAQPLASALAIVAGTSAANSGRIAYLYNTYGLATLPTSQSAGLQLAIWELEYDQSLGNATSGDIQVASGTDPAAITAANVFLADSVGKTGLAYYLNGINGTQGLIASEILNFDNAQTTGTPNLAVTKTADQSSITAGGTIGFTVSISNTGTAAATDVVLNDPLPAGSGGDINWTIAGTTGPWIPTITGSKGNQVLTATIPSLAAGTTVTVHITSPTNSGDVTGTRPRPASTPPGRPRPT